MGNKNSRKNKCDETEIILNEAYKNTDIAFSSNEVTSFKLRMRDAENYFRTKFDIFFCFNYVIFQERLYCLYENFSRKIESFSKAKTSNRNFTVLIDFEDESLILAEGVKIDFESLFVIIFEKLEINIILFFYMTSVDSEYVTDFFSQMTENADLYKYNRKFDCLYFLFPNTDYFIKNDCAILYTSTKITYDKNIFSNDEGYKINNEYTTAVFQFKEKLITPRYGQTEAHNFIENMIDQIRPNSVRLYTYINFSTDLENFISENEGQLKLIEFIADVCPVNSLEIEYNSSMELKILKLFLKKIIYFVDKSSLQENVFCLKIILRSKKNDKIYPKPEFKLKKVQRYIENIIRDLYLYDPIKYKRKLLIEIYEVINELENTEILSTNTKRKNINEWMPINKDYHLVYERLLYHWFIDKKEPESENDTCLPFVILYHNKFHKLKNKKIIKNINEFLNNTYYRSSYAQKTKNISKFEMQEILK